MHLWHKAQSSAFVCICCCICLHVLLQWFAFVVACVVAFICICCGICLHLLWHLFAFVAAFVLICSTMFYICVWPVEHYLLVVPAGQGDFVHLPGTDECVETILGKSAMSNLQLCLQKTQNQIQNEWALHKKSVVQWALPTPLQTLCVFALCNAVCVCATVGPNIPYLSLLILRLIWVMLRVSGFSMQAILLTSAIYEIVAIQWQTWQAGMTLMKDWQKAKLGSARQWWKTELHQTRETQGSTQWCTEQVGNRISRFFPIFPSSLPHVAFSLQLLHWQRWKESQA